MANYQRFSTQIQSLMRNFNEKKAETICKKLHKLEENGADIPESLENEWMALSDRIEEERERK